MRLKEDTHSWRSRGIQRRMYRQAPLTPEEETTRHKKKDRRKKKKHVHDWQPRVSGKQVVRRTFRKFDGTYESFEREVYKTQYTCARCGNKRGHNQVWW